MLQLQHSSVICSQHATITQLKKLNHSPANIPGPVLVGISMPYLHFSASSRRSKLPVPILASWPSMMFSDTPFIGSVSAWAAASIRMSTCNVKSSHCTRGWPVLTAHSSIYLTANSILIANEGISQQMQVSHNKCWYLTAN